MLAMAESEQHADVVFMDPPRSGSDEKFLSSVVRLRPEKIIYISCGPESLAEDLKYLTRQQYVVEKIQPVEMFAFTSHIETICCLRRRK